MNALFAAFAWIQFTVLFSGEGARTMGFEEYREYVRRGFGELLAVAILTMILILSLRRAMRPATEGQQRTLSILSANLAQRLDVMQRDSSWQEWPAFNFSRQQAFDTLAKLREEGKIGP